MSLVTDKAIYFYGQRDREYGFLSNFHPCKFHAGGDDSTTYKSSEQFFMKRKQETFDRDNAKLSLAILKAKTPTDAKKLGRQVRNYDDDLWKKLRFDVMVEALELKFSSDEELKQKLLATGERMLYEASHRDAIWGIGLSVGTIEKMLRENPNFLEDGDIDEETSERCFGQNLLGKALVKVREKLSESSGE